MPPNGALAEEQGVVRADDAVLEPLGHAQQARVVAGVEVGRETEAVSLARRTASSSVSKTMTPATGPKVSSWVMSMSWVTPSSSVGAKNVPRANPSR